MRVKIQFRAPEGVSFEQVRDLLNPIHQAFPGVTAERLLWAIFCSGISRHTKADIFSSLQKDEIAPGTVGKKNVKNKN